MGDEQLQREEDERYRKIDRAIDNADADASDAHSDNQDPDPEERHESDSPDE
jgi:hypothetical protein